MIRIIPIASVPKNVSHLIESAERQRKARNNSQDSKTSAAQAAHEPDSEAGTNCSESEDDETARRLLQFAERRRSKPADDGSQAGKRD